jgi:fibronectin-binding autotransporter adhesin
MKITSLRAIPSILCTTALVVAAALSVNAQNYIYWDTNGTDPGTSTTSSGNLLDPNWTIDPQGLITPGNYMSDADLFFSADDGPGTQGTGTQSINVDGKRGVDSFTFNNGAVTLVADPDDGGGITIEGAATGYGIIVNSNDGPTTFDASLGEIGLSVSQEWDNDSSQALNLNGGLAAGGNTLTFGGTGTGAININGPISSSLGIVQNSATSGLYLNNNGAGNSVTSTQVTAGTVVAAHSNDLGTAQADSIVLQGGTVDITSGGNFQHDVVGSIGTLDFSGDASLLGGTDTFDIATLTIGSGDALDFTSGTQSIGTLNLVGNGTIGTGYRFIAGIDGQGYGFLNGTTINVSDGYTFDFGSGGTFTFNNTITFGTGTALEARSGSNVILTNATLPIGGTLTVGNDDAGGFNTFIIPTAQVLTGTTTINMLGGSTGTYFNGNLSGTGGLTFSAPAQPGYGGGEGVVYLNGVNTYSGATVLGPLVPGANTVPVVEINGNSSGIGKEIDIESGTLVLGANAQIPTGSTISIGNPLSVQNGDYGVTLQIGDGSAPASLTVYNIVAVSPWNNPSDRARDLITGSAAGATLTWDVEGASTNDTFQGHIGDGSANGNNISLVKTGAGTLTLTGSSNYAGGTTINAGTLAIFGGENFGADQSSVGANLSGGNYGPALITLNNGSSTLSVLNYGLGATVIAGTAGTVTIDGDTISIAGQINAANDENFTGQLVAGSSGGTGLAFVGGDALVSLSAVNTAGNIYIENAGTRVLMFNNTNLISGAGTTVTVGNGAILDFGTGGSLNVNTPIYMESGSGLNERGTNVTLNGLVAPTASSSGTPFFVIGTDDSAGTNGSITVANNLVLRSNLEIEGEESDNGYTAVNFTGGISGTGNLTTASFYQTAYPTNTYNRGLLTISGPNTYKGDTTVVSGILDLTGDNTKVTSASGGAPNYDVTGSVPAAGVYNPGILQIGAGGSLASDANVTVGAANEFAYFVLGDNNGVANVTVGSISGTSGEGAIVGGNSGTSSLDVAVAAGTTDTYAGQIGASDSASGVNGYNFNVTSDGNIGNDLNNLSLIKSGSGTLALNGTNTYNGGTTVNGGRLAINGSITGSVVVNSGGEVGGSGFIAGGISGSGAVGPGNSPGILTANQVDPTSGLSFNFELTQNGAPTYSNSSASGNDVLHLESSMPFTSALTSSNVVNVYFSSNGIFDGGFFINGPTDNLTANVADADYVYYVLDNASGTFTYDGNRYDTVASLGGLVTMSDLPALGADFSDGTKDGFEQQFTLTGTSIPEPSTYALLGAGFLAFLVWRRRLKA